MKRKDILRKLEERLARGEINEKTYLEIKARYESEPEEPEELGEAELPNVDFAATIGNAVAQATADASRAAGDAARAVGEAMRAMDFSGIGAGTKLSDEAIKIVGSGVVSGNPVKTVEFRSAGSARVQGSLIAEVARVAGACSFEGDVQVEEFRSAGSVRIAGNLNAETIESSGSLQVERFGPYRPGPHGGRSRDRSRRHVEDSDDRRGICPGEGDRRIFPDPRGIDRREHQRGGHRTRGDDGEPREGGDGVHRSSLQDRCCRGEQTRRTRIERSGRETDRFLRTPCSHCDYRPGTLI